MIDLHTHSNRSDGDLSPGELMRAASRLGLKAIALTDHDSVDGIAEAREAAAGLNIVFIPGVEIEIEFNPGEFHLLGLGIDEENADLRGALADLAKTRTERNRRIVDMLRDAGMQIDFDEVARLAGMEHFGRPHLADTLLRKKLVRTKQEAFDRFLAKGRPFYIPKKCLGLPEAVSLIHGSGGVAVVAHPYSLFVNKTKLWGYLDEWKEEGIEGIEAFHPAAKPGPCRLLAKMALERGFVVTAGSDFHGKNKPECGLGRTSGKVPIRDEYYSGLRSVLSRLPELPSSIAS